MNLSLIYHINSNYKNLKKSLDSIFKQSSKDFEFILIDDDSTEPVKKIINEYDFSKLKKVKYINTNQKLGHSFSFNVGLDAASSKYVYYLGSSNTLNKDFIKKINALIEKSDDPDFIILSNTSKGNKQPIKFNKIDKKLFSYLKPTIKDKIFNVKFLNKNKIEFENFEYYPLIYLYKCLDKMTKAISYNEKLVDFFPNRTYTYNLYDTFEQADILLENKSSYSFVKNAENSSIYDFMIIYSILYSFLFKIHKTYWNATSLNSRGIIGRAIHTSNVWLTEHLPDWKNNIVITKNLLGFDKETIDYFKNFRYKLLYIHKTMK